MSLEIRTESDTGYENFIALLHMVADYNFLLRALFLTFPRFISKPSQAGIRNSFREDAIFPCEKSLKNDAATANFSQI